MTQRKHNTTYPFSQNHEAQGTSLHDVLEAAHILAVVGVSAEEAQVDPAQSPLGSEALAFSCNWPV